MILKIAWRECRNLFLSPLAWALMASIQFILAWLFFSLIDQFFLLQSQLAVIENAPGVSDLIVAPLFNTASILLLMICPILSMRLLAEEYRSGSINLLLSSPLSMSDIVLGKYLGIVLFLFILIIQISIMPLSLTLGTDLDTGKLAAGVLALFLLVSAFAAAGLYLSSLTHNPSVAAISTFGLLIMLWIIDSAAGSTGNKSELFTYLSLLQHNLPMLRGIINSEDISYYLLFIVLFITLSIRQLDKQRLQN